MCVRTLSYMRVHVRVCVCGFCVCIVFANMRVYVFGIYVCACMLWPKAAPISRSFSTCRLSLCLVHMRVHVHCASVSAFSVLRLWPKAAPTSRFSSTCRSCLCLVCMRVHVRCASVSAFSVPFVCY
jgi:hypothetical protein